MSETLTNTPVSDLHHAYVEAINSNDTDLFLERVSNDIVFQVPGEPELIGKAAVGEWAAGFFAGYEAHWDKTERALEQSGDLAVSRYTYTARIRSREDGAEMSEVGKGTCIYRREPSGQWLLMIDSWSTHEASEGGQ